MTPQFHPLRINRLERFGDFAVAIGFEVPDGLAEAYRYLPGQYLTLRAKIELRFGDPIRSVRRRTKALSRLGSNMSREAYSQVSQLRS